MEARISARPWGTWLAAIAVMAVTVAEIMNRELFTLRPDERLADAVRFLVALSIGGAPVVENAIPVGIVSIHDLLAQRAGDTVRDRMSYPVLTTSAEVTIEEAARVMGERGVHRIVVVDGAGRAIGIASAVDLMRGLLGIPVTHPPTFPHFDPATGLKWTDDAPLDRPHAELAPEGSGLVVLVRGGAGVRERVIWAEGCDDIQARMLAIAANGPDEPITLKQLLMRPDGLRFRAAPSKSEIDKKRALKRILSDAYRSDVASRP